MVKIAFDDELQVLKCLFSGRLDIVGSSRDEEAIIGFIDQGAPGRNNPPPAEFAVLFDLAEAEYISSAFLRLCLSLARHDRIREFSIVNSSPSARKVFSVAGLDRVLKIL